MSADPQKDPNFPFAVVGIPLSGAGSLPIAGWSPLVISQSGGLYTAPLMTDSTGNNFSFVAEYPTSDAIAIYRGLGVVNEPLLFNETTYDRERGNTELSLLASAARTTATQSADQTNFNARGLHVIIDCTAWAGNFTPSIQGKDPVSGNYYDILVGNAITAIGTTVLKIYPGIGAIPYGSASDILPRTWRVSIAVAGASSNTYSVGAALVR
jgi:hypothetical protein